MAKAGYRLAIDSESCLSCDLRRKACNAEALTRVENSGAKPKYTMTVDAERCLGCGACVSVCATHSLSMLKVERPEKPEKKIDLFKQILKEKKRLTPFVVQGVKTPFYARSAWDKRKPVIP